MFVRMYIDVCVGMIDICICICTCILVEGE